MATGGDLHQVQEQLLYCSVCLDLFKDPAITPCGHTFCQACLETCWNHSANPLCPLCKAPCSLASLRVNYVVRDIVEAFQQPRGDGDAAVAGMVQRPQRAGDGDAAVAGMVQWRDGDAAVAGMAQRQQGAGAGDGDAAALAQMRDRPFNPESGAVNCGVCLGDRRMAAQSCLVCLLSFCQEHLIAHDARFLRHKLREPVANLTGWMCLRHDKPLQRFCVTDQTFHCLACTCHQSPQHHVVAMWMGGMVQTATLTLTPSQYRDLKKHTVPVNFDESTAHPSIIILGDPSVQTIKVDPRKRGRWFRPRPHCFTRVACVLSSQPLTSTSYWEVNMDKTGIDIGNRGRTLTSWFVGVATDAAVGHENVRDFCWTLLCTEGRLTAAGTPVGTLEPGGGLSCIGVLYNDRLKTLAFYSNRRLLCTFNKVLVGRVFPIFCPDIAMVLHGGLVLNEAGLTGAMRVYN